MINVNACQILNEVDNKQFTVYVEWLYSNFNIILLESTMPPMAGEMTTEDVDTFSNELSQPCDKYLQETKRAFSGIDTGIQFLIKNETLEWKRNRWTLGRIPLRPISDITIVSEALIKSLKCHQSVLEMLDALKTENEHLKKVKTKLSADVEEMIKIKTAMEQDLYRKFLLILNSKKQKIGELQRMLQQKSIIKDSVFDASTESSEEDDAGNRDDTSSTIQKRKFVDRKREGPIKTRKIDVDTSPTSNIDEEMSPKASTSKDFTNGTVCGANSWLESSDKSKHIMEQSSKINAAKPRSSLNCMEEESEEELFSQ